MDVVSLMTTAASSQRRCRDFLNVSLKENTVQISWTAAQKSGQLIEEHMLVSTKLGQPYSMSIR
jgi:hypothetical protein